MPPPPPPSTTTTTTPHTTTTSQSSSTTTTTLSVPPTLTPPPPTPQTFHLPPIHASWPFPRTSNPHLPTTGPASAAWAAASKLFPPARQRAFAAILPARLAALAYPHHSPAHFRTACDLMHVLFAVDEVSDRLGPDEASRVADAMVDALRNPEKERDPGDHPLVEMLRSFWSRALPTASATTRRRFLASYADYARAMAQEAADRAQRRVRASLAEYLELRRYTGAIRPSLDCLLLPLEVPEASLESAVVRELEGIAVELIAVANDIVSFNVEQARGDIHNLLIVLRTADPALSVQGAMDAAGAWYRQRARDFLDALGRLPSVDGGDGAVLGVHQYCWGLGNWVTANYEWSFESGRFFGGGEGGEGKGGESGGGEWARNGGELLLLEKKGVKADRGC